MRPFIAALVLLTATPALADECGGLVDKVAEATKAEVGRRTSDFAEFTAGPDTTLSLSCGGIHPSSVGAQHRGESPPDAYYALFAEAGHAVTGIARDILDAAARRARGDAERLRHSNVSAGGALVTCSLMTKPGQGPLTLCAVIEQDDRS